MTKRAVSPMAVVHFIAMPRDSMPSLVIRIGMIVPLRCWTAGHAGFGQRYGRLYNA